MKKITSNMTSVVKGMEKAMNSMNLEQVEFYLIDFYGDG